MGVAGQIADHRLGVLHAGLGIDRPVLGHPRIEHGRDRAWIDAGELTGLGGTAQGTDEATAKV